jgi:intracellular sulfur oxidation DsrE/DsrF family protein
VNCTEAAKLLNAHSDGELELAASLAVEEHLEACAACRRAYSNLHSVRGVIARLAAPPPAPEELRLQVERDARAAAGAKRAAWLRSPLAVAAPGIVALALAGWLLLAGPSHRPATHLRVVYHISESTNAGAALRNLSNHLQAAPDATVVVVAHNNGVDFLLAGARDEAGQPFEPAIREYRRRGVEFRVCHNTLERRGIAASNVIRDVNIVPSGIAEIGRLQTQEGFAYMRL